MKADKRAGTVAGPDSNLALRTALSEPPPTKYPGCQQLADHRHHVTLTTLSQTRINAGTKRRSHEWK